MMHHHHQNHPALATLATSTLHRHTTGGYTGCIVSDLMIALNPTDMPKHYSMRITTISFFKIQVAKLAVVYLSRLYERHLHKSAGPLGSLVIRPLGDSLLSACPKNVRWSSVETTIVQFYISHSISYVYRPQPSSWLWAIVLGSPRLHIICLMGLGALVLSMNGLRQTATPPQSFFSTQQHENLSTLHPQKLQFTPFYSQQSSQSWQHSA